MNEIKKYCRYLLIYSNIDNTNCELLIFRIEEDYLVHFWIFTYTRLHGRNFHRNFHPFIRISLTYAFCRCKTMLHRETRSLTYNFLSSLFFFYYHQPHGQRIRLFSTHLWAFLPFPLFFFFLSFSNTVVEEIRPVSCFSHTNIRFVREVTPSWPMPAL